MGTDALLPRRAFAEFLGTAFLLAAVVGGGIAATRLSPDDTGLQLLESALTTGAVLAAAIAALGGISGAHLNPAVTLADRAVGGISNRGAVTYIVAQVAGAVVGVVVANLMFDLPAVELSTQAREGSHLWLAEAVATFGLVVVIFGAVRSGRASAVPFAVGTYIAGAHFFTSSTSFANPAVTVARTLSDTFAGIAPSSAGPFVVAELAGAALAVATIRVLFPDVATVAADVVMPHDPDRAPTDDE